MRNRPKILLDIKPRKSLDPFTRVDNRINLSFKKAGRISSLINKKPFLIIMALGFSFYFAGSAFAPLSGERIVQANTPQEEQKILLEQLQAYEAEIAELEGVIAEYNKKGVSLSGEINMLNARINKINLQIKAVNLSIDKLRREVAATSEQIEATETSIQTSKNTLANTLQGIYLSERDDVLEIVLRSNQLSDFFGNINDLVLLQGKMRKTLESLVIARNDLIEERQQFDLQRIEVEAQKAYQDAQRASIQRIKAEKDNLLKITKGEESKFKDLVVEKKKAAAEIRNRIFRLLGGGELRFEEAVHIAKVAENATGVRAAFILSVLTQESAINGVIGANLGKCYYNTPRNNASGTVMSNRQKSSFLAIIAELGPQYDPNTTPVSCPILRDGQYGGAMGPAQFMPTTWWDVESGTGYKKRVAAITGANPANPFNNLDAFTATALYLSDGMKGCESIYKTTFSRESCAAAKYYAGGNWRGYMSYGRYGYRVAERAADLQKDIETIEENAGLTNR